MSTYISTTPNNEVLEKDIKSLQSSFHQLLTSGCHYYTKEIANYIRLINNSLDNVKLDHEFQRESRSWIKQYDTNELESNESNIAQLIGKGRSLTQELNTCLHTTTVKNKEENQLRELTTWTCDSLSQYLESLQPFASGSYARLDNIAHHLGVTDRYIGYRHNLTRSGNQPLNVHTVWADRKLGRSATFIQPSKTPDWKAWVHAYRHYGPQPQIVPNQATNNNNEKLLGYLRQAQPTEISSPPPTPSNLRSHSTFYGTNHNEEVRKAGINLVFPGTTEFTDRYKKPEELPYSPFTVNPQPDYTLAGRPLARVIPDSFSSEYESSYVFPDSSKIEKFPWLRSS